MAIQLNATILSRLVRYTKNFNFDLGMTYLLSEWKGLFSIKNLGSDLSAGITVAFVALPLSLAIALASHMPPESGLVTAIIAGIVCALFGGAPLAVSGPAAAMSVLIADNVQSYGVENLAFICLIAGCMQLLSGIFGLGKLGRYVPLPVIAGFTAGIGVIILISQLPRAFGLLPPPESHTLDVFYHLKQYLEQINLSCFLVVIVTVFIIRVLPKFFPTFPSILPAVVIATLIVYLFNLKHVPLIGPIPASLPSPHFPKQIDISLKDLILNAFTIYLLASLETLLSCSALDKLMNKKKYHADQELIGQGFGNMAVSLFSGIPVTSVIARSVTNIRAGAKTRRASIVHSFIILLTVFGIAPLISMIPIAALAGVLFSVAFSMINYKEFRDLWNTSRPDVLIYVITFLTIIFVDLVAGVQIGMLAAGLIVLLKAAKTNLHISSLSQDNVVRLSLTGSLTFLSSAEMIELEKCLEKTSSDQTVVLDLSGITNIDSSGAAAIADLFNYCRDHHVQFYIKGVSKKFEPLFKLYDNNILDHCYLVSESELKEKEIRPPSPSSRDRLIHGIQRFYAEKQDNDRRLYDHIVLGQDPHTLFIACSDSRIVPSLITSTDPGELFTIRNVGNYIPPYHSNDLFSEAAALEFALNHLEITDIVVCGHANCGAIYACCNPNHVYSPKLKAWVDMISAQLNLNGSLEPNEIARLNVLNQVENLKQYPVVKKKLESNLLKIHAWFLDFDQHRIYEWSKEAQSFNAILLATQ